MQANRTRASTATDPAAILAEQGRCQIGWPNKAVPESPAPAPHVAFARFLSNKTQPIILTSDPLAVYFFVVEYDACLF